VQSMAWADVAAVSTAAVISNFFISKHTFVESHGGLLCNNRKWKPIKI